MTGFESREKRIPIPVEGEGGRIEQAGLDYANGISVPYTYGQSTEQTDEQSLVPDPTDETARSGIDLEEYHKG